MCLRTPLTVPVLPLLLRGRRHNAGPPPPQSRIEITSLSLQIRVGRPPQDQMVTSEKFRSTQLHSHVTCAPRNSPEHTTCGHTFGRTQMNVRLSVQFAPKPSHDNTTASDTRVSTVERRNLSAEESLATVNNGAVAVASPVLTRSVGISEVKPGVSASNRCLMRRRSKGDGWKSK